MTGAPGPADPEDRVERPGPVEMRDPMVRRELARAGVWIGLALLAAGILFLAQPLLLIVAGIVFAAMLDGGARLLGRVLPIARGWRIAIVSLVTLAFIAATIWFASTELAAQAATFRELITAQSGRLIGHLAALGIDAEAVDPQQILRQAMSGLGRLTTAVTSVFGVVASIILILVIGLYVAIEPRLYERGIAWMLPLDMRDSAYRTMSAMGRNLRYLMFGRLIGMAVEGFATWALLLIGGVPMAGLLGLLTGLLAFIPNVGAFISGTLVVLIGFSAGFDTGLWAIGVYLIIQFVDGYVIVPYVDRKTVDLAPALVLGAQLLFGALFGFLGLALADPIMAMLKTALHQKAEEGEEGDAAGAAPKAAPGRANTS